MMALRTGSLRWRLIGRLVILQTVTLTLLLLLAVSILAGLWRSGASGAGYEGSTLDILKGAVERDAGGALTLRPTQKLAELRAEVPNLWVVIRDPQGQRLAEGTLPPAFVPVAETLDHISDARLGWSVGEASPPAGLVKWVDTAAGKVQILTGTEGRISMSRVIEIVQSLFLNVILPIVGVMTLAT